MTRGDEDVEGAPRVFRHPRGGLRKQRWASRGAPKIVYTSNQHMTSSYRLDGRDQSTGKHSVTINF